MFGLQGVELKENLKIKNIWQMAITHECTTRRVILRYVQNVYTLQQNVAYRSKITAPQKNNPICTYWAVFENRLFLLKRVNHACLRMILKITG
jgi:hypothetical protein